MLGSYTELVNRFHLHYAEDTVPFQEAIQISRTSEEKEEENTDQNLQKKKKYKTLDYEVFNLNMMNTFKYNTKAPG